MGEGKKLEIGKCYDSTYSYIENSNIIYVGKEESRYRFIENEKDRIREIYAKGYIFNKKGVLELFESSFGEYHKNSKILGDKEIYNRLELDLKEAESLLKGLQNK